VQHVRGAEQSVQFDLFAALDCLAEPVTGHTFVRRGGSQ
jgi:hypothetical protein